MRFITVVHGRLKAKDSNVARQQHDAVASGSDAQAKAVGQLSHRAYLNPQDPQDFLAIEFWSDPAGPQKVFGNPEAAAAIGALFEAPPTVMVFHETDWFGNDPA
jgi:quinol monooxygenase YgiN